MSVNVEQLAWMDGKFIPYDEARVHVRTDCVIRGGSVFEGIPGYWSEAESQLYLFRVVDHMRRLQDSMHVMRMSLAEGLEPLREATVELVARMGFREDVHARPTVYFGDGPPFEFRPELIPTGAFVTAIPMPRNVDTAQRGLKVGVSSWRRISDGSMPPRIKHSANYQNSRLAQAQARVDNYDTAILLNDAGHVSETPAACVFLVRDGELITPRITDGILESITRATIMELASTMLDMPVRERSIDRTELYLAAEAFEAGSAHEVTPITSVDGYLVGDGAPGPLTRRLMSLYNSAVRGQLPAYRHWLTPVYPGAEQSAS